MAPCVLSYKSPRAEPSSKGRPWNKIGATSKTCGTVIGKRAVGGAAFYPGDGAVTALGDSNLKYSRRGAIISVELS